MSSGPSFSGSNRGSNTGTLVAGETATYIAYYIISDQAATTGAIINTVSATASSPGNSNDVSDISDDGIDNDGNTVSDTTVVEITPLPSMEITKTATVSDVNSNSVNDQGDIITYTIIVSNTGNVTLGQTGGASGTFVMTDTFLSLSGVDTPTLNSGPTFVGANKGSAYGLLKPGEMATFNATYIVTQDIVNAGGVSNQVEVRAITPNGSFVSDVSDDGISADGELFDDPTINGIAPDPSITITKSQTITDNAVSYTHLTLPTNREV